MVTAPINHICLDERGVAYVTGTRIKVRHIAVERNVWKQSPEQIQESYPHLSLAQVHAALAFYFDHQETIDEEIVAAGEYAEQLRVAHPNRLNRQELEERLRERDIDPAAP